MTVAIGIDPRKASQAVATDIDEHDARVGDSGLATERS